MCIHSLWLMNIYSAVSSLHTIHITWIQKTLNSYTLAMFCSLKFSLYKWHLECSSQFFLLQSTLNVLLHTTRLLWLFQPLLHYIHMPQEMLGGDCILSAILVPPGSPEALAYEAGIVYWNFSAVLDNFSGYRVPVMPCFVQYFTFGTSALI